ncbi:uncharacterized protein SPPG_04686 [Spizellomyces punctatus DAOM BR117]|uniref:AAA+ ATPase domain-containing protein n=1 Tax=Spizellomyces punctatus (strain DAOM BR117) TaxID=645134 RepID=A0A0L0HH09_SPIPD|nr:uncharacterized protein SPPG_04686 [Spizellomyces punctatus DAOM BR117]KND00362.1 hypothetical protein SPPG_04686 [Spizellomyces punctatus DAOM BR117]|eukprot:XP_016608401.1 hypothetical protein SPPG_04686 [Spizellomyces punctatus DAOM BR117]
MHRTVFGRQKYTLVHTCRGIMSSHLGIRLACLRQSPAVPVSASLLLGNLLPLRSLSTGQGPGTELVPRDGEDGARGLGGIVGMVAEKVGVESNQFATGGLTLAVFGAVIASAGVLWRYVWEFLQKQLIVSAEFDSRDEAYSWLLSFLADHPMSQRTTRFSVTTSIKPGQKSDSEQGDAYLNLPRVYFLPSPGTHLFTFNKRILWLSRERAKPPAGGAAPTASLERITINVLGRNRKILESLVRESQRLFIEKDRCRTVIYAADQYGNWRRIRSRPIRHLSTIVLDEGIKELVLKDVKEFLASEKWYADRGIPYRRGYMFYGKPGTGKTSFVTALAGELKLNIYVISLANRGLTDETLTELMVDTPPRCILLLEDIDAAFVSRTITGATTGAGQGNATIGTNVTFSGLLNAIDGVAAQEGRLVCMTTNHLEKLDPALIRPGRVDLKVLFDLATKYQARELFIQFYPHTNGEPPSVPGMLTLRADELVQLAEAFAKKIPDRVLSMAQIQGFLMKYKSNPWDAVKKVDELLNAVQKGGAEDVVPILKEL